MKNIWYDADTLLEEVLDTMPDDIKFLFDDQPVIFERDIDDSWKTAELNAMDIDDDAVNQELQDFHDNACCANASVARQSLCGCGGSGDPTHLSAAAQRALRDRLEP